MRSTISRKTKIALFAGVLFCIVLAVTAFSKTTFAFAQEPSRRTRLVE